MSFVNTQNYRSVPPTVIETTVHLAGVVGQASVDVVSEMCRATLSESAFQQLSHAGQAAKKSGQAALEWSKSQCKAIHLPQSAFNACVATTVGLASTALCLSQPRLMAVGLMGITAWGLYALSKAEKPIIAIIKKTDSTITKIVQKDIKDRNNYQLFLEEQTKQAKAEEEALEWSQKQEVAQAVHKSLFNTFQLFTTAITPHK